jgi:hypothetical protein
MVMHQQEFISSLLMGILKKKMKTSASLLLSRGTEADFSAHPWQQCKLH